MGISVFDSVIFGGLLSDDVLVALFDDHAHIRAMLDVEAALALAEGKVGVIPRPAAEEIAKAARALELDPSALRQETAKAAIPVPALVGALREAVGGNAAQYVHWGATTQDIMDTGLVLRLRQALDIIASRLNTTIDLLANLADTHRTTVMVGRTRYQQAVPTSFGLKVAGWLAPLVRNRDRLGQLRPRALMLSFGGAAGTLSALGEQGAAVASGLADELNLPLSPMPWHSQRDGIAELSGWLSLVTASLGKMGQDVLLMAQSEVGEVREGLDGGGSSTMPQKANPVASEVLVTLARANAGLLATMHQAMLQEHERGGPGWQLEWATLPQMVIATGCALGHAERLTTSLEVNAERMRDNLDRSNGLILAEAASFALSQHLPRPRAQALVKAACLDCQQSGRHLLDVLAEQSSAPVNWSAMRDPANHLGTANGFIDAVLQSVGTE